MKRLGTLYQKVCSLANLQLADQIARKGKGWQYGVKVHDRNRVQNIVALREILLSKIYRTSPYTTFTVFDRKEREVFRLPYFPDRITHHAIMNVLEPIFVSVFTADTYSCIKGRGIHAAARAVRAALCDHAGTQFCLKLDVRKFYPSIDHDIMKQLILRKIKDPDLLWLLDDIIDSAPGLPIGNYLSQYLANFYLTYFDHWIKEDLRVKYYFRYADDLVILGPDKNDLHQLRIRITQYLNEKLKLQVKENYQVFPVASRGIDFVGYVFYHTHTRLRKGIKKNFARMISRNNNPQSIASYMGWALHCNSNHLIKTLLHEKVQRPGHNSPGTIIHRRQDQDQQNFEPSNNCSRL